MWVKSEENSLSFLLCNWIRKKKSSWLHVGSDDKYFLFMPWLHFKGNEKLDSKRFFNKEKGYVRKHLLSSFRVSLSLPSSIFDMFTKGSLWSWEWQKWRNAFVGAEVMKGMMNFEQLISKPRQLLSVTNSSVILIIQMRLGIERSL